MKSKSAFTLVETLIATSILATILSIAMGIFLDSTRVDTYTLLHSTLITETQYVMNKMTDEIKRNTIDYPEYYNYYVLNGGGALFDNTFPDDTFGSNYLVYGSRFYNPGAPAGSPNEYGANMGGLSLSDDLGTWCTTQSSGYAPVGDEDCEGQPSLEYTEDVATGTNPYSGEILTLPTQASAICDSSSEMFPYSRRDCSFTSNTLSHEVNMLFLINPDGNEKTMIGREPWYETSSQPTPSGYSVSLLRMTGSDEDSDGVNESWQCAEGFFCTTDAPSDMNPVIDPDANDLTDISSFTGTVPSMFYDFVPVTPASITITDLRFYIAPIEDPYKAFGEFPERVQPHVYISLTAELTDEKAASLPVSARSFTLFREVSLPFTGEINNY